VPGENITPDALFTSERIDMNERRQARRASMGARVEAAAELANGTSNQFICWCDLNAESEALTAAIPDAVEVRGSQSPEDKAARLLSFIDGRSRVLVSKPSVAGFGLNLQCCHDMAFVGLKDFRGRTIEMMQDAGWRYYGEITIDKNPQVKAIRTKDAGLLFKSLATDSAKMHVALPDWVLHFRKDGDNAAPIRAGISEKYGNPNGWITQEEWIRWARPVWYAQDWAPDGDGIHETDVLNVRVARDSADERHICPLQLPVIARIVKLWGAPGETVFSPFAGIGSEGHEAVRLGRKFVGVELKESYWKTACRNLRDAEASLDHQSLFEGAL
jgi:hypothetical protein